jgi:hypothetical protein
MQNKYIKLESHEDIKIYEYPMFSYYHHDLQMQFIHNSLELLLYLLLSQYDLLVILLSF